VSYQRYLMIGVLVLVSVVATTVYSEAQGAPGTFYVATDGNDAWLGRLPAPNTAGTDGPFAPLTRARDAIREVKANGGLHQPLKVLVRGGTYYMAETLTLGPQDSGTASFPITYMAYPGEKVILSGGRLITGARGPKPATAGEGAWKPYRGNIWQCDLNPLGLGELSFKQLFYNGQRQPLARFPNVDPQRPRTGGFLYVYEGGIKDSKVLLKYDPAQLEPSKWAKPTLAEVDVYCYHNWHNLISPIAEIDLANHIITLSSEAHYQLTHDTRFYIRNVWEELDAPGEWYLDSETGTLYFWPPDDNRAPSVVVIPALDSIIQIKGDADSDAYVHYVRIGGFAIQVCQGHAVLLEATQHCTIAKCTITNTGKDGVRLFECSHNRVVGNDVAYIGNVGVQLYGQDNLVSNNHIYDTGCIGEQGRVGYTHNRALTVAGHNNVASHNLIHDVPAFGLVFNGHDDIIEYNYIHHFGVGTGLSWGINSNARGVPDQKRGNILRYNKISDAVGYSRRSGEWGPNPGMGICLDDFISYTTIYGNVLVRNLRGGVIIHGGENNIVENNIMSAGRPSTKNHWRTEGEPCYNKFLRNIIYYANADPLLQLVYGWTVKGITETTASAAAVPVFLCGWSSVKAAVSESDYNLLFPITGKNVRAMLLYRGAGEEYFGPWADQPVADRFAWWRSQGYDPHSVIGDPLFVDVQNDDFRLRPESPAFKLGFKPIPVERIGLYPSPNRASWPVDDHPDTWQGEIQMSAPAISEAGLKPNTSRPQFRAAQDTAGITIDGDVSEWPWDDVTRMVVMEQQPTGQPSRAPKSYACAAYDDEALYIAVRNLVRDAQRLKITGEWGNTDAVEIPFQDVSGQEPGPILNLYGFPDGHFETATGAPTPPELVEKLAAAVSYAAQIGADYWSCEWRIPWAAAGIDPRQAKKLRFNVGVYKSVAGAWIAWKGTHGPNWVVQSAGDLILLP